MVMRPTQFVTQCVTNREILQNPQIIPIALRLRFMSAFHLRFRSMLIPLASVLKEMI